MNTSPRERTGLIAFLGVISTLVAIIYWQQMRTPSSAGITLREASAISPPAAPLSNAPISTAPTDNPALQPAPPAAEIVVHVTGAVKKPGVYHLPLASRGDDAIKVAGGATADANPDALNLAAHLEDGSQIHVPTRKEQSSSAAPTPDSLVRRDTGGVPKKETKPAAAHSNSHTGHGGRGGGKLKADSGATININTADAETLQKLPGIGPSMADRILDYRKTNGGFKTPEELMEVSGIGPKKFDKMQPFVRVK